mmetsp:Transcript_7380/g.15805  ORF Transcript_7380/g.15805 Transcript_7380/m.15805 type:complete len:837 (-) Transcript_7380:87-2597(-)
MSRSARSYRSEDDELASSARQATSREAMKDIEEMNQSVNNMFKDKQKFTDNVEMALRGAVALTLVISITLVPGLIADGFPRAYKDTSLIAMVGFWFVLTFWKDVGSTARNAAQALMGTLYAVGNSMIMNAVYPGGAKLAHINGYDSTIAWADLAVAVFLLMFLNVSDKFRTFGLFYIAMFMMHYMNPYSVARFSRNFQVDINGTGMSYLIVCASGCFLAIICTFLPYPRFLSTQCSREATDVAKAVCGLMAQVVELYAGTQSSSALHQKCQKAADRINEKIGMLEEKIGTMWWEGFDIGSQGQRRHLLQRFLALVKQLMDIIHGLEHAANVDDEAAGGVLKDLAGDIDELIRAQTSIMIGPGSLCEYVTEGDSADHSAHAKEVLRKSDELARDAKTISQDYTRLRIEGGHKTMSVLLLEEDFLIYNLSALAQVMREFAITLMQQDEIDYQAVAWARFLDTVDPFSQRGNVNFVFRGYMAYMLAFIAGVYIYGYDFTLAATIALILSRFTGSALERNLGRMQGVVLGLVLPAIAFYHIPTCSGGFGTALFICIIIIFEGTCLYIYYSASARFAFIGMLTAAFAAQAFFQPCDSRAPSASLAFTKVTMTVTAILLMATIDLSVTQERPSQAVHSYQKEAFTLLRRGLRRFYAGSDIGQNLLRDAQSAADKGIFMASQANNEPRFWRTAFPLRLVDRVFDEASDMCADLRILNRASHSYNGSHKGTHDLDKLLGPRKESELWQQCTDDLFRQFDRVISLLIKCVEHESSAPNEALLKYEHNLQANDRLEELVEHMSGYLEYDTEADVLDDDRTRVGVALFILNSIHNRLDYIVEAILRG